MFEMWFEINGRKVSPDQMGNEIEKAAYSAVRESIVDSVGLVRCPDHGEFAQIVCKGRDLDNLSFEISGCCQKLIDEIARRLQ